MCLLQGAEKHVPNFTVHTNHLGMVLKCRYWFSKSEVGRWDSEISTSHPQAMRMLSLVLWGLQEVTM